jgi:hypothetical protein
MATIIFTLPTDKTNYDFIKILENEAFRFSIKYNRRMDSWFFSMTDFDINEVRIAGGVNLLELFKHKENILQGSLELVDLDRENKSPTRENFGDRLTLQYIEPE